MPKRVRSLGVTSLALAVAIVISACGSSSSSSSSSSTSAHPAGSTGMANMPGMRSAVTLLMGTAPDSLDPQLAYTTQGAEPDWISYLGLYTYAHTNGTAGGQVIPALATALPVVSADKKTYSMTLRPGLKYSNGAPVKASDLTYSIERALKLNWGGDSFYTGNIIGAMAYSTGKATTISGITADDASGKITIKLMAPYGAFENILAFPSSGFVPAGTAMKPLSNTPPPGVGPYMITNVVPNQSFSAKRNPSYTPIPGIPAGHVDVNVKIESNTQTETEDVLNNSADVFDWADTISPALLPQVTAQAQGRYQLIPTATMYYFFLNTKTKPFNSQLAREAVVMAIDRGALSRLDSGNLTPACYFLPPSIIGHPSAPCPYGDPAAAPNVAKAKALVAQAGLTGAPVTVYGETRSPRKEYIDYYTSVLNSIGFKATEKILADAQYFPTIGNLKLNPQTGFADWNQDFPNPGDFYLLLDKNSIQATNNQNFGQIDDPTIQSALAKLNQVPSSQLQSVAGQWSTLEQYVAKKAYTAVFGYNRVPSFTSNRLNYAALVFNPVYGTDWSSLQLK